MTNMCETQNKRTITIQTKFIRILFGLIASFCGFGEHSVAILWTRCSASFFILTVWKFSSYVQIFRNETSYHKGFGGIHAHMTTYYDTTKKNPLCYINGKITQA